jgi:hypothetical protein
MMDRARLKTEDAVAVVVGGGVAVVRQARVDLDVARAPLKNSTAVVAVRGFFNCIT